MASGMLIFQWHFHLRGWCKVVEASKNTCCCGSQESQNKAFIFVFGLGICDVHKGWEGRFENDKYFQQTGFLPAIEVTHTHIYKRAHIPVRCWQVLEEAKRSICHLQHLLEKSSGNMGPLLTKITSLNTDTLQQRGQWELKLVEGIKKKNRKTKLPLLPSPSPIGLGRVSKNVKMQRPRVNLKVHLIGSCASPPLSITNPPHPPTPCTFPLSSSSVALVQLWRPFLLLAQSAGQNGKPAAYY